MCGADQHVSSNKCVDCAPGTTNAAGDLSTGVDTDCTATLCAADEYVSSNACEPCAPGETSAAGADASGDDTACAATLCAADEYVVAYSCVACATGYTNEAGDDATSDAPSECTLPPVTGMCAGNDEPGDDVTCGDGKISVADATAVEGTDAAACCVDEPADPPVVTFKWEATAYTVCAPSCEAADKTRTVTCVEQTLYTTGTIVRSDQLDAACTVELAGAKPAAEAPCDVIAAGASCDDGDDATMDDVCAADAGGVATGVCAGAVQLVAAIALPVPDIADIVLPAATATAADIDASPIAASVKTAVAGAMAGVEEADITVNSIAIAGGGRRRLQEAGSLEVDYTIALPAAAGETATETADAAKAAAAAADQIVVTIPADATVGGVAVPVTVDVPVPVSYAYVSTSTCGTAACSNTCGAAELTAPDVYTCLADGAAVPLAQCHENLGAQPATETTCCPAADADTCEQTGRAATSCAVDESVTTSACVACAAGKTNALEAFLVTPTVEILVGDSKLGADTECAATLCAANEYVSSNACTACAAGKTSAAGADASGADTVCAATLCAANEYVSSNVCTACARSEEHTSELQSP